MTNARERLVEQTRAHRLNPLRVNGRSVTRDTCPRLDLAIDSHTPYGARIPAGFDHDQLFQLTLPVSIKIYRSSQ